MIQLKSYSNMIKFNVKLVILLIIALLSVVNLTQSFYFKKADKNYRLDNTTIPNHYDIQITPYFRADNEFGKEQYTFDGLVSINFATTVSNTNQLRIHALNINVSEISILLADHDNSTREILTNFTYDSETEILTIVLTTELIENMEYILAFEYSGKIGHDLNGFYFGLFKFEGKEMIYGATQAQPTFARKIFPCFDEPALKATFQLTIRKPKEYNAYSNTNELSVSKIPNKETYDKVIFKPTPHMSTYLLAFVIGPFTKTSVYVDCENKANSFGIIVRSDVLERTAYTVTIGQDIIRRLGEYLDYDYYKMITKDVMIEKFDLIALPNFGGLAMENWGIVVGREDILLYKEHITSSYSQQRLLQVLVHEITHQWFGNLVTCNWWSNIWLNEAFATYFQYFIGFEIEPSLELEKQFVVEITQLALLDDSNRNSKPLKRFVETQVDSIASFDSISYNKGAAFLKMIHHLIGETEFRNALQRYLKRNAYSITTSDKLFCELGGFRNPEYIELFETWTTQNNYPLVTVIYDPENKEAVFSQKVFQLDTLNAASEKLWHIPLTFTTTDGAFLDSEVKVVMKTESITIPVDTQNSWLILNVRQVGFYRVNYDYANWEHIRRALFSENHGGIPEENRAQIVDDLFNLARANEISYKFTASMLEYLITETSYLPWFSAINNFTFLLAKMDERQRENFKAYICKLLNTYFKEVGWLAMFEDIRFKVFHRSNLLNWLIKFGHENSMLQSKKLYATYKDDQRQEIRVHIRSFVFCNGVRYGDIYDVIFMWSSYLTEEDPSQQQTMLEAMACASRQDAVYLALNNILSTSVKDKDRQHLVMLIYTQTEENVQHVLDYYINHHDKFIAGFKGHSSTIISILVSLSDKFTNINQIDQMQTFYQSYKETYEGFEAVIRNAVVRANENIAWNQANLPKIMKMIQIDYRLDENIIPKHYELEIIPYLYTDNEFDRVKFTFDGIVKIHIMTTSTESTTLRLNLKELAITKMLIINEDNTSSGILIINILHDADTEIITLVFDKPLQIGHNYILIIEYNGYIRDDLKGFYLSYHEDIGERILIFTTKLQTTTARLVFPCFDEPHYRTTFLLNIVKPVECSVYSNTKAKTIYNYSKTYDRVQFIETPVMATWRLTFTIAKCLQRSENTNGRFGTIGRLDHYNQSNYALSKGWSAIKRLGEL